MPPRRRNRPHGRTRRRLFGRRKFTRRRRYGRLPTRFRRRFSRKYQGRRRFKRSRRGRGRSLKKGAFAKKVVKALAPSQSFFAQYGQLHTVPALPADEGRHLYFTTQMYQADPAPPADPIDMGTVKTLPLMCNEHLGLILSYLWKGALSSMQASAVELSTTVDTTRKTPLYIGGKVSYQLRNQSTEDEIIKVYWCKARRDVTYSETQYANNIYTFLASGFAENGVDSNNPSTTNGAMICNSYTPFNSYSFTRKFKITRTQTLTLRPGKSTFVHTGVKSKRIIPDDIFLFNDTDLTNFWENLPPVSYLTRYGKFCLFEIQSRPIGYGAAQTTFNKLVGQSTPTVILESKFSYSARIISHSRTPIQLIDVKGFAAPSALANTIINPDVAALDQERDAV